jgi:hypothetical protein
VVEHWDERPTSSGQAAAALVEKWASI